MNYKKNLENTILDEFRCRVSRANKQLKAGSHKVLTTTSEQHFAKLVKYWSRAK